MRLGNNSRIAAASCCQPVTVTSRCNGRIRPGFDLDAKAHSGRLALRPAPLCDDFFLDIAQTVLAEIDFVSDEECRRAERAARHRVVRVLDELLLDVVQKKLIENTNNAVARGTFGSPTFFVGDEIYFGKDSLRDVEEEIVAQRGGAQRKSA